MHDFRILEVVDFIRRRRAHFVALQFPEGLKVHGIGVARELERLTGCHCLVLADPCYGACDLSMSFRDVADVLVHFGHSPIPSMEVSEDTLFVEVALDHDVADLLPSLLPRLQGRVGLVSTPQHLHLLPEIERWLEANGVEVSIGEGDRRVKYPGQVLGCNVSAASAIAEEVDQFVYVGSGDFHPLAVALETRREVLVLDLMTRQVRDLRELKDRVLRQRHAAIALAQEARSLGILVSTKPGQRRRDLAMRLRSLAESKGRTATIIAIDNVTPDQLLAFRVDAFVSTACPRVAIDDALRFRKPMLTPVELEVALGERSWDDYIFDSIPG
jgi:2-(3-amino-3-carboxypropyl)histidine synthase